MRIKKRKTGGSNAANVDNDSIFLDGDSLINSPSNYQMNPNIVIFDDFDFRLEISEWAIRLDVTPDYYSSQWEMSGDRYGVKAMDGLFIGSEQWENLIAEYGNTLYIVAYAGLSNLDDEKPFKILKYASLKNWKQIAPDDGIEYVPIYIAKIEFDPTSLKPIVENCKSHKFYKNNLVDFQEQILPVKSDIIQRIPIINKIYSNISQRDRYRTSLKDGQVVKVKNASEDPQIISGWAIYKYYKFSDEFNLIAGENVVLPKPEIKTDNKTIFKASITGTDVLFSPSLLSPYVENIRILDPIDYRFVAGSSNSELKGVFSDGSEWKNFRVETPDGIKFIRLQAKSFYATGFQNCAGKRVFLVAWCRYYDNTDDAVNSVSFSFKSNGEIKELEQEDRTTTKKLPLFYISAVLPESTRQPIIQDSIRVSHLWKQVFYGEKIEIPKPQAPEIKTDNKTIFKYPDQTLIVPDAKKCYRHDIFINEDFDFDFNYSDPSKIIVFPKGADSGGNRLIDVTIKGANKKIKLSKLELPVNIPAGSFGTHCNFMVIAHVVGDIGGKKMDYGADTGEYPCMISPDNSSTNVDRIALFALSVRKPLQGQQWKVETVQLYKWWKQIILPYSPAELPTHEHDYTQPDNTSIVFNLNKKLVAYDALQTNHHSFRVFEDFDFKVIVNNQNSISFRPTGGNRIIKASKFGKDLHLHLNKITWQIQASNRGKWSYRVLVGKLTETNITTLQDLGSYSSELPPEISKENYAAPLAMVRIFLPEEGTDIDEYKIEVYQLHKKYLGTFDELMRNYKERNP